MTKNRFMTLYCQYNGTIALMSDEEIKKILSEFKDENHNYFYYDCETSKVQKVSFDLLAKKAKNEQENYESFDDFIDEMEMKCLNAMKVPKEEAYEIMKKRWKY